MSAALAAAPAAAGGEDRASAHAPRAEPRRWTALAFVCAPAPPVALGALAAAILASSQGGAGSAMAAIFRGGVALAFRGCLSALLIAVPVYGLILRRRAIPPALSILFRGFARAIA